MKIVLCLLMAVSSACAAEWVSLFDGKTMTGWVDTRGEKPPGTAWTIEDGCLKATKNAPIIEDLFSQGKYKDFELEWDWRISPAGNSGMKYRIQDHLFLADALKGKPEKFENRVERTFANPVKTRPEKGQDYVIGFEYQMTDDLKNRDALSNPKHTAGALYDMVVPESKASLPVGEFNHSRLVVRGKHVEHWLNGKKVVDTELTSAAAMAGIDKRWADAPHVRKLLADQPVQECPISLQNHGDEAWFRNIRIRKL